VKFIWDEYVKDFWVWCKKYKAVYFILGTLMGIYFLSRANHEIYMIIVTQLKAILNIILSDIVFFIFGILVIILMMILLRKSDQEFQRELDEGYPESKFYKSEIEYPIKIYVSEGTEYINGSKLKIRELKFKNMLNSNIEIINGKAEFYNYNERVKIIDFNAKNIRSKKLEIIYKSSLADDNWNWDELYIIIDNIESKEYSNSNFEIRAVSFIRTHFLVLNGYNYIRLGKHRLPYEITWIRDKVRFTIIPLIQCQFKVRVRMGSVFSKNEILTDYIKSYLRIIFFSIVTIGLFAAIGFASYRFFLLIAQVIVELLKTILIIIRMVF
jgi:hypothetical protein